LHGFHRAEKVGFEGFANGSHISVRDGIEQAMSGIVDPDVNAFEMMHGKAKYAVNFLAVADIARKSERAIEMTDALASGFGTNRIAGENDNASTLIGENFRDGFADAHRRTSHDGDFSRQRVHMAAFMLSEGGSQGLGANDQEARATPDEVARCAQDLSVRFSAAS
jgi:hypothetical protein